MNPKSQFLREVGTTTLELTQEGSLQGQPQTDSDGHGERTGFCALFSLQARSHVAQAGWPQDRAETGLEPPLAAFPSVTTTHYTRFTLLFKMSLTPPVLQYFLPGRKRANHNDNKSLCPA